MIHRTYQELKKISLRYDPADLVISDGFIPSLYMAKEMLLHEEWDEELQEYAVKILEELRRGFPKQWDSSWKYDAFLGYAYHIILKYDERYKAYLRAFNKVTIPSPELLVAMANCFFCPGQPPITIEQAISFVKQAIENTQYFEAVESLRALYKFIGNSKEQKYWESI